MTAQAGLTKRAAATGYRDITSTARLCRSANTKGFIVMNRRVIAILLVMIASFTLTSASVGWSQNISATLRGTVRDSGGAVISGAEIVVPKQWHWSDTRDNQQPIRATMLFCSCRQQHTR